MNKTIFSLKLRMKVPKVSDLQDLQPDDETARRGRTKQTYVSAMSRVRNEAKNMKFYPRELSLGSKGEAVSLLHKNLRTFGFDILEPEIHRASFGLGTRDAVAAFQNSHDSNPAGLMGMETAAALNHKLSALQPISERDTSRQFRIRKPLP